MYPLREPPLLDDDDCDDDDDEGVGAGEAASKRPKGRVGGAMTDLRSAEKEFVHLRKTKAFGK